MLFIAWILAFLIVLALLAYELWVSRDKPEHPPTVPMDRRMPPRGDL